MSNSLLLNILDLGRAFGLEPKNATPEQICEWLLSEYLRKKGGKFNYNPAINALYELFRGAATLNDAMLYCLTSGNPKGRSQNVQAIKCVGEYALKNISTCYRRDFVAVAVGRISGKTIYIGMKAPMIRIRDGHAHVVLPGFRKTHRPVGAEIDLACSVALATLARDDYSKADFEYLDAGAGVGEERQLEVVRGRDRMIYDVDEVDALLDVYVRGVALALETGAAIRNANLRGYRVVDPSQPSMF